MAAQYRIHIPHEEADDADFTEGSVAFVGTATTIIEYGGFRILTDPNFLHAGDHVHLGYGLFSTRVTDPAIEPEQLPPIDFCILSHFHGDHWDRIATRKLPKELPVVTTPSAARALRRRGFYRAQGLKTWESVLIDKGSASISLTSMPGRHAPAPLNAAFPPVMGSLLQFTDAEQQTVLRLYITGDTLLIDELKEIRRRYPQVDLALLHLGGTRILGLMVTMDARQGVELLRIVQPRKAIPIHYNDYKVFKSPLADFQQAVREAGLEDIVTYLKHGEIYRFRVPGAGKLASSRAHTEQPQPPSAP